MWFMMTDMFSWRNGAYGSSHCLASHLTVSALVFLSMLELLGSRNCVCRECTSCPQRFSSQEENQEGTGQANFMVTRTEVVAYQVSF